jgi:hypothetical protein
MGIVQNGNWKVLLFPEKIVEVLESRQRERLLSLHPPISKSLHFPFICRAFNAFDTEEILSFSFFIFTASTSIWSTCISLISAKEVSII